MANHSSIHVQEPHEQYEKTKRYDTGRWALRSEGVYCATREKHGTTTHSPRKNEAAGPKQKQCSVVDVSSGESQVRCCKEQYCIGTYNIRCMNQGKLEVAKQELARVNIDILGIR